MKTKDLVALIAELVEERLLRYGNVQPLTDIASDLWRVCRERYEPITGVEATAYVWRYRKEWMERVREKGRAVVPVTELFIALTAEGLRPTKAQREACVAGTSFARKTVAVYLPQKGDRDPYAKIHQSNRAAKKRTTKMLRDIESQGASKKRLAELQQQAPHLKLTD